MKVKTFRAPSVQQALQQVKAELGDEAMIIHSHRARAEGIAGILGRQWVEVAAATESMISPHPSLPVSAEHRRNGTRGWGISDNRASPRLPTVSPLAGRPGSPLGVDLAGDPAGRIGDLRELRSLVTDLRQTLDRLQVYPPAGRRKPPTRAVAEIAQRLRSQGLSGEAIDQTIEALERELSPSALADAASVRRAARSFLAGWVQAVPTRLSPVGPDLPPGGARVLFLLGPTGVGKTTTIAKLAALAAVGTRRRVTLVTTDNYRIGAIDQLRRFAGLLRLPIRTANTPQDLVDAIAAAPDLVLVDTPGCSQYDDHHLSELRQFVGAVPGSATYLVTNASAMLQAQLDTADRFAPFDGIVVSKVDEAPGMGPATDLLRACRKPVAFLTTGPQVPDDVEPGSADGLLRRLFDD